MEGQNSNAMVAINSTQSRPASVVLSLPAAASMRPNSVLSNRKAGTLPANLEEMKVVRFAICSVTIKISAQTYKLVVNAGQ